MVNLKVAFLAGVMAMAGFVGAANAVPLSGTFNITVYRGPGNGNINDANNQANLTDPLLSTVAIGTGTYTGALNFNDGGSNDILTFLQSAGGTVTGSLLTLGGTSLSTGGFGTTSVFVITGDVGSSTLYGSISHDDGVSLYTGLSLNTLLAGSPAPTTDIDTSYSGLTGIFKIVYVEANSIPAVLDMDVARRTDVPEPLTLSLFGAGLAGLGAMRRRRKAA